MCKESAGIAVLHAKKSKVLSSDPPVLGNIFFMALTRLLIKDFRNIENADLALAPGFNFLVGANGSGKTSVLEAIYTLGHGRAFRSLQAGRVIRHDQNAFILHGRIEGAERDVSVGLTKNRAGDSKVRIAGSDGHKVAELAQMLPMQLITPEGFSLLNGGPKYRRAYIDWGCFHNESGFLTHGAISVAC